MKLSTALIRMSFNGLEKNLNNINVNLSFVIQKISDENDKDGITKINSRNDLIKKIAT